MAEALVQYLEKHVYLLPIIALLHNHSHAITVLPANDARLQHHRRFSCMSSLVLLVPTQPKLFLVHVRESVSPQSTYTLCQFMVAN